MEQDLEYDRLLNEAQKAEREQRWSEAASIYERASRLANLDPSILAACLRRAGLCSKRAAFESETREDFERSIQTAREKWSRARGLLVEAKGSRDLLEVFQNDALIKRVDAWLVQDSDQRRKLLEECCTLWTNALQQGYDSLEVRASADVLCELTDSLLDLCELERDWKTREKFMEQAIQYAKLAVPAYSKLGDDQGLARAYRLAAAHCEIGCFLAASQSKREKYVRDALEFCGKAVDHATKADDPKELGLSLALLGFFTNNYQSDNKSALEIADRAVEVSELSKDHLLRAIVLERWCETASILAMKEEEPARMSELGEKSLFLADQARQHLSTVRADFIPLASETLVQGIVEANLALATGVETSLERKKARLESALNIGTEALTIATISGSPVALTSALHSLSKVDYSLALLAADPEEKRARLESALKHRQEAIKGLETALTIGIDLSYLGDIQLELARTEPDQEKSRKTLEDAAETGRRSLPYLKDHLIGLPGRLGNYYERVSVIFGELYSRNNNDETLRECREAFQETARAYREGGLPGRAAETFWQLAKILDGAGRFSDASRVYGEASACYSMAAEKYGAGAKKVPSLSLAFQELAQYMGSWVEIEQARFRHNEAQYPLAAQNYAKAAGILHSTETWGHLSKLYGACSVLEHSEALSRRERQAASAGLFSGAAKAFREARGELENRLVPGPEFREKQELRGWAKVADERERYCLARVELEEAKILDKKGEKVASSIRYRSASAIFRALHSEAHGSQDQKEFLTLALFCDGWAKMKEAEAEASPEAYSDAAETFTKAKDAATSKSRLSALANAAICKALASGTRFRLTQDAQLYSEIKKQMQTAADYYEEAGLEKAAEWTRASQRLFDSLVYLADAETEVEPRRKTELYHLAEKHLEVAARLFGDAGFSTKKKEALKHLRRIREEKQILLTPVEILAENPAVSGIALAPVTLTRDQALGLERFETASVVGNLSTPRREVQVGAELTIELELANVGRTAATLVKLENIVPEGFEFNREKNQYRIEGDSINLKGKRLDYLETCEVRIVLKALLKGVFELRPELLFVDDKGSYRSHNFESTTLTVRELGISGWLKGPPKLEAPARPPPLPFRPATPLTQVLSEFSFETERARDVFLLLLKEFREDYMSKRLYVEKAGWRSLMDVVRELNLPRSAVYTPRRRNGPVVAELERRGLVETRVFPEERGRGGEITKVRIAYDNAIVRRLVEQAVLESS